MSDTPDNTTAPTLWHAVPVDEVLTRLQSCRDGLTTAEARARLQTAGPNELQSAPQGSLVLLFLRQFESPLILMLLAAALISAFSGHVIDAIVIMSVVLLNAVIGVVQEWRAERALEALRRLGAPRALVLRDRHPEVVPARDIVPGDILVLESGQRIAADARLLESIELTVDESAVTGESTPVEKINGVLQPRLPLAERSNMVWMASPVSAGRGRAVVVATGMGTVMGGIADEVRTTERSQTPLQRRLSQLATWLGFAALGLSLVIFLLGLLRGYDIIDMVLFAVAAAVSAIPEGLPAVISVVLALGVQRMATRNAVLRRLPAVETLGSTTVICSDKTGTITRNEMTVIRLYAGGTTYEVSGEGFAPEGAVHSEDGGALEADALSRRPALRMLLTIGSVANDAILEYEHGAWHIQGDPTEGALLVAARKAGIVPEEAQDRLTRQDEIPFSSKAKYMATLNRDVEGDRALLLVKGAPEQVLAFCASEMVDDRVVPLTEERRQQILAANSAFADHALRVLAGAYRPLPAIRERASRELAEHELVFAGLWGMIDPPRPEAVRAIRQAQDAGIRVIMITGDSAATAAAIARQAGIAAHGEETISGADLDEMPDEELRRRIAHVAVFARVAPADKLRLVNALRDRQEIVAMTGDGVNDAPALKQANIGIAMGITGTEVSKEAADMVLADDNFATIVRAVEEGRVIFNNLRKVIFFLVTTNLGEILTLTAALVLGMPLPLTAVQILWVNLVTDGLCTTPLGVEPGHGDVLRQPPRSPQAGIIERPVLWQMLGFAALMAAGTLVLFQSDHAGMRHSQTVAFTTLVAFQWFHAFNARSRHASLFAIGVFGNRWLLAGIGTAVALQVLVVEWPPAQRIFDTATLSLADWGLVLLVASSVFVADELRKLALWLRRRAQGVPHPSPSAE